jgi:hypothetical protein
MANCPNCGSDHIVLKEETNVNWGRALTGWALFGVVGGAVGAVTGEDRNVNACLDCGTSWKATDLYNLLKIIKIYTNNTVNLSKEKHRIYMDEFIKRVIPYIESITISNQKSNELIKRVKEEVSKDEVGAFSLGCMFSIVFFFGVIGGLFSSVRSFMFGMAVILTPSLLGLLISIISTKATAKFNKQRIEMAMRDAEQIKNEAMDLLTFAVNDFMREYPFDE